MTATATDPDTEDALTYVWDELDLGIAQPAMANGSRCIIPAP